jgi:hypothetical protein
VVGGVLRKMLAEPALATKWHRRDMPAAKLASET